MPIFIHNGTGWQVASQPGGLRPKVHDGTAWQPATEVYAHDGTGWKLVYQYDATAPTGGTVTVTKNSNGAIMDVAWTTVTDTESGITSVVLERKTQISGGVESASSDRYTIYSGTAVSSVAGNSYSDSIDTGIRKDPATNKDWFVFYRLRMTDFAGNTSYSPWVQQTTKPLGTFIIDPTASKTRAVDNGAWNSTTLVISGWYDSTGGYQNGYFFYGSAISTVCAGYAPNSGTLRLVRNGAYGSSGQNYIMVHAHTSQPAGAPTPNTAYFDAGPNLTGSGASANHPLPSGWMALMQSGVMAGVLTTGSREYKVELSGSYRQLVPITSSNNGRLTLVFS